MAKGANKGEKPPKKGQQSNPDNGNPNGSISHSQPNSVRWFKKGPRIGEKARKRINYNVENKLFDVLEGKKSVVKRATPPGIGVSTRGLAAGDHYLPENRLLWWQTYHQVAQQGVENGLTTDAIRNVEKFPCEFSKAVGNFVTWETLTNGTNPNELPDLEFTIRSTNPQYRLVVRERNVQVSDELGAGTRIGSHRVVVHERPEGTVPDPNQKLPSTMIFFNEPQRSVGISFGFVGEDDQTIPAANCRLIAYDINGGVLATATGGMLQGARPTRPNVPSRTAYNLLGVTDRAASIAYVEFEFDRDHVDPESGEEPFITAEQVIYRVWHEPFPSVAVLQGHFEITNTTGAGVGRGAASFDLPFHCTRSLATLRGYHAEFLDGPHELRLLEVNVDIVGSSVVGRVMMNTDKATPWRARIFYSVVAWDHRTVTLETSYVAGKRLAGDSGDLVLTGFHPCQSGEECPMAGALTNLSFSPAESDEVEDVVVSVSTVAEAGVDEHGSRKVSWPVSFAVDPESRRSAAGYVLGSPSLTVPKRIGVSRLGLRHATTNEPAEEFFDITQGGRIIIFEQPPRAWNLVGQDYQTILDENNRVLDFAIPSAADMAFVSIAFMELSPEGPIRQIGAEVIGSKFDGAKMQFKMAGGIATDEASEAESDLHTWGILPQVIGLSKRLPPVVTTRITKQDVVFTNAVDNVVSLAPNQYGAVANSGSGALQISSARLIGAQANEFSLVVGTMPSTAYRQGPWFENLREQGLTMHILDIESRGVTLRAGETLLIGGACLPSGSGSRSAILELTTNDRIHPIVQIEVTAEVIESQADALIMPTQIEFGTVAVGQSRTRVGLVASIGQSPLLITDVQISGGAGAFSFAMPGEHFEQGTPDQVEPGETWPNGHIQITYAPGSAGLRNAKLVVTTNAGSHEIALSGTGG